MKVLLLSPYPERLADILRDDDVIGPLPDGSWPEAEFVVSYGYRKIIKEPYLSKYKGRMINIHLSLLPWNRGSDPNFWAWFDNTPHGISIHHIDAGIDTGAVICQLGVNPTLDEVGTLESTYNQLQMGIPLLFYSLWADYKNKKKLRRGHVMTGGSFHYSKDKEQWMARFPLGWKTPVADVMALGKMANKR